MKNRKQVSNINRPLVTVLMAVYNSDCYVQDAVDSILKQSFHNFEFIIVNDDSTDSTEEILSNYNDPRILLLSNNTNRGLTQSLNRGLAAASGEYVARQDADDISLPDRLARQVNFLDEHQNVAAVGSGYIKLFEDGRSEQTVNMPLTDAIIRDRLFYSHCFCHGSVMMRRSCLEEVNRYDERFKTAQDRDLWLRLAERYSLANLPDPLYKLRIHTKSVTGSRRSQQRQAARQAVLNTLERGILKPAPIALGRFYWHAFIDELAAGDETSALMYLEQMVAANNKLDNEAEYMAQTAVNRAFEVGPASLSHNKSTADTSSGLLFLKRLFTLLPIEMQHLRGYHRWATAELHAAYAFAAFHQEKYNMVLHHSWRSWLKHPAQLHNLGLLSVFVRSLWRCTHKQSGSS